MVGVDSPLGWPRAFVEAVHAHQSLEPWPGGTDRSMLTHRDTDRAIRRLGARAALSCRRTSWVLSPCGVRCCNSVGPESGANLPHETAADDSRRILRPRSAAWAVVSARYEDRRDPVAARTVREQIVRQVGADVASWLDLTAVSDRCVQSDHVLDALVSGLVAVATAVGATHWPSPDERGAALVEGWIHVPSTALFAVRPSGLSRS